MVTGSNGLSVVPLGFARTGDGIDYLNPVHDLRLMRVDDLRKEIPANLTGINSE